MNKPERIYVASRASVPERPAMWRRFRDQGCNIVSSWIDQADVQETADYADLWLRVTREIHSATRLVLYAEPDDFPLKGALVEVGIALGSAVPVYVVAPGVVIEPSYRPIGSWLAHPLVTVEPDILRAMAMVPVDVAADTEPGSAGVSEPHWRDPNPSAHHIWCNKFGFGPADKCSMCKGLNDRYPHDRDGDPEGLALMAEHFPENQVIR